MIYEKRALGCVLAAIGLAILLGNQVVAAEASAMADKWQFKIDPEDVGINEQWFDPKLDDRAWSSISTHRWKGWEEQGLAEHEGFAWYRVTHQVPEELGKKHVYLYFAGVGDAAWVWVNGQDIGITNWYWAMIIQAGFDSSHSMSPR